MGSIDSQSQSQSPTNSRSRSRSRLRSHQSEGGVKLQRRRRRREEQRSVCVVTIVVAMAMVATVASLFGTTRTVLSFSTHTQIQNRRRGLQMMMIAGSHSTPSTAPRWRWGGSSSCSSFVGGEQRQLSRRRRTQQIQQQQQQQQNQSSRRRRYGVSSLCMMPEGPEVRTLVDQLQGGIGKRLVDVRFLSGRYVQQRPKGFFEFAQTMTPLRGRAERDSNDDASSTTITTTVDTILDINCKGKFIYVLLDDGSTRISSANINGNHRSDDDDNGNNDKTDDDGDDFQRSIWITLGMTGRFVNDQQHREDPSYGRWVLELVDETITSGSSGSGNTPTDIHRIHYHDKRNFGTVRFCLSKHELDQKLASLGPDVLAMARQQARVENHDLDDPTVTIDDELAIEASTEQWLGLLNKQRNPKLSVCKFLMDQTKVSGVGNYILSEALYRANIDPFCGIDELSTPQRTTLFDEIRAVCYESYLSQAQSQQQQQQQQQQQSQQSQQQPPDRAAGVDGSTGTSSGNGTSPTTPTPSSTSSTSSRVGSGYTSVRSLEPFDFRLRVYGQLKCPRGNPVIRETKGPHGRTIWYTEEQLFVPRHVRERQGSTTSDNNNSNNEDRWTITRRDGIELGESPSRDQRTVQMGANAAATASTTAPDEPETNDYGDEYGESWNLLDGLHEPGWKRALEPYAASSRSFEGLQEFLREEYATLGPNQIYPPRQQIFAALNLCPIDRVKVVILGQDPYHGPNQSTGLAFSVSKSITKIPPSLRNIFKELDDDIGNGGRPPIRHGDLEGWAKQGVLMLNTVLTVRRGKANSHQKKGWEDFTDEIVCSLRDHHHNDSASGTRNGIVFLLWGGPAAKKAGSIVGSEADSDSNANHVVIATSHPSPLGATKTASPFLTSRCFSRVNEVLVGMGKTPIDWYDR